MEQWDSGHMCNPTIVTCCLSWIANMLSTLISTLSLHKSGQDLPDLLRLAWADPGHTPMTSHPGLLWDRCQGAIQLFPRPPVSLYRQGGEGQEGFPGASLLIMARICSQPPEMPQAA